MHKHKVKLGSKKEATLEIIEPDGIQAAILHTNVRAAKEDGDYDEIERINNWIVDKCTNRAEFDKLGTLEQIEVINIISLMALGNYDPAKKS